MGTSVKILTIFRLLPQGKHPYPSISSTGREAVLGVSQLLTLKQTYPEDTFHRWPGGHTHCPSKGEQGSLKMITPVPEVLPQWEELKGDMEEGVLVTRFKLRSMYKAPT